MDKFVGVKWPASQPNQPHCFQDLALCVEPPVPDSPGALLARLVKALDGIGAGGGFAGGSPGVIGEIFQLMVSASIQSLVTQGFIVAGAISDSQPTVFPELELAAEAGWLFNDRAKDVRRDRAHAWQALKLAHFPKGSTDSLYFLHSLLPLFQRVIQLTVKPSHHPAFFLGWELAQILLAPFEGKDLDPVQSQHAPLR